MASRSLPSGRLRRLRKRSSRRGRRGLPRGLPPVRTSKRRRRKKAEDDEETAGQKDPQQESVGAASDVLTALRTKEDLRRALAGGRVRGRRTRGTAREGRLPRVRRSRSESGDETTAEPKRKGRANLRDVVAETRHKKDASDGLDTRRRRRAKKDKREESSDERRRRRRRRAGEKGEDRPRSSRRRKRSADEQERRERSRRRKSRQQEEQEPAPRETEDEQRQERRERRERARRRKAREEARREREEQEKAEEQAREKAEARRRRKQAEEERARREREEQEKQRQREKAEARRRRKQAEEERARREREEQEKKEKEQERAEARRRRKAAEQARREQEAEEQARLEEAKAERVRALEVARQMARLAEKKMDRARTSAEEAREAARAAEEEAEALQEAIESARARAEAAQREAEEARQRAEQWQREAEELQERAAAVASDAEEAAERAERAVRQLSDAQDAAERAETREKVALQKVAEVDEALAAELTADAPEEKDEEEPPRRRSHPKEAPAEKTEDPAEPRRRRSHPKEAPAEKDEDEATKRRSHPKEAPAEAKDAQRRKRRRRRRSRPGRPEGGDRRPLQSKRLKAVTRSVANSGIRRAVGARSGVLQALKSEADLKRALEGGATSRLIKRGRRRREADAEVEASPAAQAAAEPEAADAPEAPAAPEVGKKKRARRRRLRRLATAKKSGVPVPVIIGAVVALLLLPFIIMALTAGPPKDGGETAANDTGGDKGAAAEYGETEEDSRSERVAELWAKNEGEPLHGSRGLPPTSREREYRRGEGGMRGGWQPEGTDDEPGEWEERTAGGTEGEGGEAERIERPATWSERFEQLAAEYLYGDRARRPEVVTELAGMLDQALDASSRSAEDNEAVLALCDRYETMFRQEKALLEARRAHEGVRLDWRMLRATGPAQLLELRAEARKRGLSDRVEAVEGILKGLEMSPDAGDQGARDRARESRMEVRREVETYRQEIEAGTAAAIADLVDWMARVGYAEDTARADARRLVEGAFAPGTPERRQLLRRLDGIRAATLRPGEQVMRESEFQARLHPIRQKHSDKLLKAVNKCLSAGEPGFAFDLFQLLLRLDPDNEKAHKGLKHVKVEDRWLRPYEAERMRQGYLWDSRLGWVKYKERERYDEGGYYDLQEGRWTTVEEANRRHAAADSPWRVESEHFELISTADLGLTTQVVERLEAFFMQAFRQYDLFFGSGSDTALLIFGVKPVPRMTVYFYRSEQQFRQHANPPTDWAAGFYSSGQHASFFYANSPTSYSITVLQHEVTHQILGEWSPGGAPSWLAEGVAVYLEDAFFQGSQLTLGDLEARDRIRTYRSNIRSGKSGEHTFASITQLVTGSQWDSGDISANYRGAGAAVYFLLHFDGGRYRADFLQMLRDAYQGGMKPLGHYFGLSEASLNELMQRFYAECHLE